MRKLSAELEETQMKEKHAMKASLLDVSGVLRDNRQAIWESYLRVLKPAGFELDGEVLHATVDLSYRLRGLEKYNLVENCIEAMLALLKENVSLKDALQKPATIDAAVTSHPFTAKKTWAAKVKTDFRRTDSEYLKNIQPLDGAREGLHLLSFKYRLGAVSNSGSKFNKAWLKYWGFSRFFSIFVGEQEVAQKKPNPGGIFLAAKKLFTQPTACYYVGDSQSDMIAANNAGAVPVGVLTGTSDRTLLKQAGAAYVFSNLYEASKKL